ncbi:MAG TPA: DUF6011 domain-containing protein [Streptosporangiaceae bacterium]
MSANLTDDDRRQLTRCTIGGLPLMEWLASDPAPDRVRAHLVKFLDRGGTQMVFVRVLSAHIGADPVQVYTENWPRKAAKLAAAARERGDQPHASQFHRALVALMFCANCGRPLEDPVSIGRGIGPDCWTRIDPAWRTAIEARTA